MIHESRMIKKGTALSKNKTDFDVTPSAVLSIYKDGVIPVGDASFARDPLGSQGLSAAVSDGQSVAIAIHSVLSDSLKGDIAIDFLKRQQTNAILKHQIYLNESYSDVPFETPFWITRRVSYVSSLEVVPTINIHIDCSLIISKSWSLRECPVLNGDSIELALCLCSNKDSVRWLAGKPIEDFKIPIDFAKTPRELIAS